MLIRLIFQTIFVNTIKASIIICYIKILFLFYYLIKGLYQLPMLRLNSSMFSKSDDIIINKLTKHKILTVIDFVRENKEKLMKITDLSLEDIKQVRRQMIDNYSGKIKKPLQLLKHEDNVCSTGITILDNLLGGGLMYGQIIEICGQSSSGKSQLCYTLALNIAVNYSRSKIYYIYTKNFSASRIQMILENKKLNDEISGRVMNQINAVQVKNVYQLLNFFYGLVKTFKVNSNEEKTKLIIIDSLSGIFVVAKEHESNFSLLTSLNDISRYLANEYLLSIVVVNSITQLWRDDAGFDRPTIVKTKPTLGKYWLSIPNIRLLIEKKENETRTIKLWMSETGMIGLSIQVIINNAGVN